MRITARVPATSANLGPGFDCFGLALDLCNEVTVDTQGDRGVAWEGEGANELPTDGTDMVSRAIASAVATRRASVPAFALHGVNRIPLERGLGSSSAAAVAGIALAAVLLGGTRPERERHRIAAAAAELEGHVDNAAPATYGGLTVVADGRVRRFDVHEAIRPVALVPAAERLSTARAREALPDVVGVGDAVYNIGHGALLVQALVSGDLELLREAVRDRIHQEVRLSFVPEVREVFRELDRTFPVCVSGSGPTLLAFEREEARVPELGSGWRILRLPVRASGFELLEQ